MVSNVVKRFKEARLPAGSSWHEVTDKDGRRWITSVNTKGGKWTFIVKEVEFKKDWMKYELQVEEGSKKHRWPSLYTREAEAKKEAEIWAQAVKTKGPQPLTGWKPV